MLERLVKSILANTARGLDPEGVHASTGTYANLFTTADTLRHSRFLGTLFNSHNLSNIGRQETAQRLKWRLCKVSQHISAISDFIKRAKRFLPIPYRWVTDTITACIPFCLTANLARDFDVWISQTPSVSVRSSTVSRSTSIYFQQVIKLGFPIHLADYKLNNSRHWHTGPLRTSEEIKGKELLQQFLLVVLSYMGYGAHH